MCALVAYNYKEEAVLGQSYPLNNTQGIVLIKVLKLYSLIPIQLAKERTAYKIVQLPYYCPSVEARSSASLVA